MKNEKKLTAQDLALYYRGQAKLISRAEKLESFHGFAHVGQIVVIDIILLASVEQGLYEVKPILRPLSSITEAEMKDNHEAYKVAASGLGKLAHGSAASTRHWLSLHIDLFGWIEAGLAIDKTK
mgnify:FL=1